nr:hypothetical protein [uncultured Desulfobacter sp.]
MTIDYILMEVPNFVERKYGVLDTPLYDIDDNLDIHMQGACDKKTLLEILVRAASLNDSIDHTCKTIEDVPGANNIRYHLGVFCPSPPPPPPEKCGRIFVK